MKPGDHPEFFRFPAPQGRSRESTIVLDKRGRFFHDGELIEHEAMSRAFASWLRRHPDDGRYILSNGYDWTYLTVEGTPFFVLTVRLIGIPPQSAELTLSDGTKEALELSTLRVDSDDALVSRVKNGAFDARFTPGAQTALADALVTDADGRTGIRLGETTYFPPPFR